MPFSAIKGTFHVIGYSPDGDSIRFKANNKSRWDLLSGRKVKLNAKEHAQLRIEAIDTLETHYKQEHQPLEFADKATKRLFKILGIKNVQWNDKRSKVISAADGAKGYILSRTTERNGRPVCFVFDSSIGWTDGQQIHLDKATARKSVNFKMLRTGLAYPTFYDGLFYDLREVFARETVKVRKAKKGLWKHDATNKFLKVTSLKDVTDTYVIMPKLFRRIVAHFKQFGSFDAEKFVKNLAKNPEKIFILTYLHFTHFDNVIQVENNVQIKLTQRPENLIFIG